MQVKDNHFYQKLSVMLIYNKLMTSSVMTSFYDHVILIKKMIRFAYRWELKMMVKNFEIWNFSSLFRFVDHFRSTSGFLFLLSVHFRFASGSLLKSIFVDITLIIRVNCWKIYWSKICRFLIGCQLSTFDSTSRSLLILFSNSHPQETSLRNN